jgi:hypothetical protein
MSPGQLPEKLAQDLALLKEVLALGQAAQAFAAGQPLPANALELFAAFAARFTQLVGARATLPTGSEPLATREEATRNLGRAAAAMVANLEDATAPSSLRASAVERFVSALKTLGVQVPKELPTPTVPERAAGGPAEPGQAAPAMRDAPQPPRPSAVLNLNNPQETRSTRQQEAIQVSVRSDGQDQREGGDGRESFRERMQRAAKGRLMPKALWNALHTFRAEEEDSVEQKDRWNRLMVVGILVLTGIFLGVVILVNL